MAGTTRFVGPGLNRLISTGLLVNGVGGYTNAPALVQASGYPMANLDLPDRYTPWVSPTNGTNSGTPGLIYLDFDMGGNIVPTYVGFHGIRQSGLGSLPWILQYLGTGGVGVGTYNGNGTWTNAKNGTISGQRDVGALIVGGPNARFWRFSIDTSICGSTAFGTFWLSTSVSDLGFIYSPGMQSNIIHPTIAHRSGSGHLSVVAVGDTRAIMTMPFRNITDTTKSKLDSLFGYFTGRDPAVWIDPNDQCKQVVLANSEITWEHSWAPPNLWNADIELEVLG